MRISFRDAERRALKLLVLSLLTLAVYATVISFRWKVDFHHDGYIFFQINALSQGKIPFEDFLVYRGVLYPFLIDQLSPGNTSYIYQVKMLNVAITLVTAILVKIILDSSRFRQSSLLFALLWLATSPSWTAIPSNSFPGSNLVDPNYLSIFLLLLSAFMFFSSSKTNRIELPRVILSGALIGLSPWVQQKGLLFPFLFFILSIVFQCWKNVNRKIFIYWSAAALTTMFLPLLWISKYGLFRLWFEQTFLDPFQLSLRGSAVTSMSFGALLIRSLVFISTTIIFVGIILLLNRLIKIKKTNFKQLAFLGSTSLLTALPFLGVFGNLDSSRDLYYKNWLIIFSSSIPNMFWYFTYCSVIGISVVLLVRKTRGRRRISMPNVDSADSLSNLPNFIFAASLGMSAVFFLYPNFGYFWYFAPATLVSCVFMLESSGLKNTRFAIQLPENLRKLFIIPFIISGLTLFLYANSKQKFTFTEPALQKMVEFSQDRLDDQQSTIQFINQINMKSIRLNDCLDVFMLTSLSKETFIDRYYGPIPAREVSSDKNDFEAVNIITCSKEVITDRYQNLGYLEKKRIVLKDGRQLILWSK